MPSGKRIYLHIGTEKTGTTSIQSFMHANRDRLRQRGCLYPQVAGQRNHMLLALYAGRFPRVATLARQQGLADEEARNAWRVPFAQRLRDEIAAFDGHSVLLSNEHCWSRLLYRDAIERLRDLLAPVAQSFHILVYFRPQDELLWSSYSTSLKSGSTRMFQLPASAQQRQYHYLTVLDEWSAVFGRDAISAQVYDSKRLGPGALEGEVSRFAGIEDISGWRPAERQNTQLDVKHQEFLRRFNQHVPFIGPNGLNPVRANVVQILERRSQRSQDGVPRQELERFYRSFARTNAELADRYFGLAGQPLFRRETTQPAQPSTTGRLTVDEAVEIAAALWVEAMQRCQYPAGELDSAELPAED